MNCILPGDKHSHAVSYCEVRKNMVVHWNEIPCIHSDKRLLHSFIKVQYSQEISIILIKLACLVVALGCVAVVVKIGYTG